MKKIRTAIIASLVIVMSFAFSMIVQADELDYQYATDNMMIEAIERALGDSFENIIASNSQWWQAVNFLALDNGIRPPATWAWNGHINGTPHFGILSYQSSVREVHTSFTIWMVTYSGWVYVVGR